MLDYVDTTDCRMEFLRASSTTRAADGEPLRPVRQLHRRPVRRADVDDAAAADTRARLMRPGVELAPRKQWPTGLAKLGVDVERPHHRRPAAGRVIGRLTDLGWGARLRRLLDEPDGEVPDDVVRAAVEVLAAWDWETRPTAVMALDSERRPQFVARRHAQARRTWPASRSGHAASTAPTPPRDGCQLRIPGCRAERVMGGTRAAPPVDGPLLLVDDVTDTGWTLTMAARVLRQAGAPVVLPFAVASVT